MSQTLRRLDGVRGRQLLSASFPKVNANNRISYRRSYLEDNYTHLVWHSQLRVVCGRMGTKSRYRPRYLAWKLRQIRNALGLSQSEMLRRLDAADTLSAARISEYESGTREPSLRVLLAYGQIARVHVEALIDDEATLPDTLPGSFIFQRYKKKLDSTPNCE